MTTYTDAHKRYYERHKKEIFERNKETKRAANRAYYHKNKKAIAQRRKAAKKQALRNLLVQVTLEVDRKSQ